MNTILLLARVNFLDQVNFLFPGVAVFTSL